MKCLFEVLRVRLKLLQVVGVRVKRSDGKLLCCQGLTKVYHVDVRVDDGNQKVKVVLKGKITCGSERIFGTGFCVEDLRWIKTLALNVVDCVTSIHVGGC